MADAGRIFNGNVAQKFRPVFVQNFAQKLSPKIPIFVQFDACNLLLLVVKYIQKVRETNGRQ